MKVLLVDDDELVRTTILDMLEDAGFEVTEAASPEAALHRNGVRHPDVLITDINLGSSLNGFDVAAAAHRLWPAVLLCWLQCAFPRRRKSGSHQSPGLKPCRAWP